MRIYLEHVQFGKFFVYIFKYKAFSLHRLKKISAPLHREDTDHGVKLKYFAKAQNNT